MDWVRKTFFANKARANPKFQPPESENGAKGGVAAVVAA